MLISQKMLPISEFYKGVVGSDLIIPDEAQFNEICKRYGLKKDNFYLVNGIPEPFVYWDKEFLVFSFMCFDEPYLLNLGIRRLPKTKELLSLGVVNLLKNTPSLFQMFLVEQNIKSIADEELSEIMETVINPYLLRDYEFSTELNKRLKSSFVEKRKIKELFKSRDKVTIYSGVKNNSCGSGKWGSTEISTAFFSSIDTETNRVGDVCSTEVEIGDVVYYSPKNGMVITNKKMNFEALVVDGIDEKKPEVNSIFNKYKSLLSLDKENVSKTTRAFSIAIVIALYARANKVSRSERDEAMLLALLSVGSESFLGGDTLSLPSEIQEMYTESQIESIKAQLDKDCVKNKLVTDASSLVDLAIGNLKSFDVNSQDFVEWFKYVKIGFCLNFED